MAVGPVAAWMVPTVDTSTPSINFSARFWAVSSAGEYVLAQRRRTTLPSFICGWYFSTTANNGNHLGEDWTTFERWVP